MKVCPTCGGEYPSSQSVCPRDRTPLSGSSRLGMSIDQRYLLQSPKSPRGVGEHYLAQDLVRGRAVSVRIVHDRLASREPAHVLLRQNPALQSLRHPNLVAVEDFGVTEDQASYYVTEPLWGATLQDRLLGQRCGWEQPSLPGGLGAPAWLDPLHSCTVAVQVARGLHALHGIGLVYEALHPRNVIALTCSSDTRTPISGESEGVQIKLLDPGTARLSGPSRRTPGARAGHLGHAEYSAPEQSAAGAANARTDQYGLGCLLFQMLTGKVPFQGRDRHETLWLQQHGEVRLPPQAPGGEPIPVALDLLLQRALQKRPEQRFASMAALEEALQHAMIILRVTREPSWLPPPLLVPMGLPPGSPQPPPPLSPPRLRRLDPAWLNKQRDALRALGDPRAALQRAQELRQRLGGPEAPLCNRAACLLLLADAYRGLWQPREAELLYQETLRLLLKDADAIGHYDNDALQDAALVGLQELLHAQPDTGKDDKDGRRRRPPCN